jgi:hypothetical protein
MTVETYSPKRVELILGGVPLRGYSDGTFIQVERTSDAFTTNVGADGEVSRTHSADKTGTITVTLQQTSDSNDFLSGLVNADEISLQGQVPVLLKDTNGRTLAESPCAWVMKVANSEFANEISDREWVISCSELIVFVGGNN